LSSPQKTLFQQAVRLGEFLRRQNFAPKFAVIPAELAVASASRNSGLKRKLDYRFRGNDKKGMSIYSVGF
jgi:hypothetical protein